MTSQLTDTLSAAETKAVQRVMDAVAAFDRGACPEEATGELIPELFEQLPDGPIRSALRPMFQHLAADPPRPGREEAVRSACEAIGPNSRIIPPHATRP